MQMPAFDASLFQQTNFYVTALGAYLIGSIPFAVIIARFAGIGDITKMGSGNPGATNMARQGGKKLGALTLLLDAIKGVIAVIIGKQLGFAAAAALFVVFGHCFSIFLKFRGGKGVATTLGALLSLYSLTGIIFAMFWLILFFAFRISSLAALIGIWLTAIAAYFFWFGNLFFVTIFFALLLTIRHKSNIKKLIEGSEI